ncbi:MAG: tetratricopeptide repeat protein [Acidobacteriota bacterium]
MSLDREGTVVTIRRWACWVVVLGCGLLALLSFQRVFVQRPEAHPSGSAQAATLFRLPAPTMSAGDEMNELQHQLRRKPDHTPVLLRMAEIAREKGRPSEAVKYLREALQHDPDNGAARVELGRALYEAGDTAGALLETRELLKREPENVDALYNMGAILGNLNRDDEARQYWEKAIALAPASESGGRAKNSLERLAPPAKPGPWH